jgi:hypothetical protein
VSSINPYHDAGDVDRGEVVGGGLLVAACDGAEALDVMEEALNGPPKAIEAAGFSAPVVFPRRVHRDHRLHATIPNRGDYGIGIVPSISDQRLARGVLQEQLSFGRVVLLAGG